MKAFSPQKSYKKEEILDCAEGNLFGPTNGRLPTPDMLMFDRITEIDSGNGKYNKGRILAELGYRPKVYGFLIVILKEIL